MTQFYPYGAATFDTLCYDIEQDSKILSFGLLATN